MASNQFRENETSKSSFKFMFSSIFQIRERKKTGTWNTLENMELRNPRSELSETEGQTLDWFSLSCDGCHGLGASQQLEENREGWDNRCMPSGT